MAKKPKQTPDDAPPELAIPLPLTGLGSETYWQSEISESEKRRKKYLPLWRKNIDRYRGELPPLTGIGKSEVISVNVDFYNTEQKKPQLFFQTPAIQVSPRQDGLEEAAVVAQHLLNEYLGPHEIDAKRLVEEVLFDVLCPAGFGATKIGYEDRKAQKSAPVNDPQTGQPVIDPKTGQPAMQMVPTVIWQHYYWEHIPPEKLLLPATFLGTRYEDAPWLGFEFSEDLDTMAQRGGYRDSLSDGGGTDDQTLAPASDKEFLRSGARGYEIWYKASLYDPTVQSPQQYRRLVLVKRTRQRTSVIVHENSPVQQFDPQTGAYVSGMLGNPIHILTTRAVTDTAYPPSDCTISRPQVDELSLGRSQMVIQRRRNLPLRWFLQSGMSRQQIDKIVAGEIQGLIGLDAPAEGLLGQIAPAQFPRENFTFNDYIQQDVDRYWAMSGPQSGVHENTTKTATELSLMKSATDTRMAAERERVLSWFVKGVEKLFALFQLFADESQVIAIVGENGDQQLKTWNKQTIQGRYAFSVKPDSSVRIDAAEERDFYLRAYNLLANDPNINRAELVKGLAARLGLDPAKVLQQPPPPPPEKPKVNFSFKGEDLLNPIVLSILEQTGIQIQPDAIAQAAAKALQGQITPPPSAQRGASNPGPGTTVPGGAPAKGPQHPSPVNGQQTAASGVAPVNKHAADLTGRPSGRPPLA